MHRTVRLFIAVELDDGMRARIVEAAHRARPVGFRTTAPDQLHLTIRFLGAVPGAHVPIIEAALARACARCAPFVVEVRGGGIFGPPAAPKVAWIGIEDGAGTLRALARAVDDELEAAGFEREARAYHPHLTIGRAKRAASVDLDALTRTPSLGDLHVDELVLFRSETLPEGSRYTPLLRVPLGEQR